MAVNMSAFRPYSLGVVAENPKIGAKELLVTPTEAIPTLNGAVRSSPQILSSSGVDADGKAYQVEALTDTTITALWLPDSANRSTPPNMRRNMRVQLYRVADSDTFYWRDLGLDQDLKRLETVGFVINNNPDAEGTDATDADNSWYVEMSTHTGLLTVHTTKSNGEPFAYDIQLNAKAGKITITDDDGTGNAITLDSMAKHLQAILSTGTELSLDGNNVYVFAPQNIDIIAKENITFECQNFSITAEESYSCKTKNWFVDSPVGEFTGLLKVGGLATTTSRGFSGKAEIDAELVVKKDFTAEQNVTVSGQMHAQKVISDQNIDAPNV